MARKTIASLEEEIRVLKAEIIEYKDKISNVQLENTLLKGLNETLKLSKQVDEQLGEHNRNIGADEELKIKLDRAIQRNKNIISDYAKCSKENQQLKKQLQDLEVKQIGRPKRIDDNTVQKVIELREENKSIRAIAKELNISVGSVHNIIEQNKK